MLKKWSGSRKGKNQIEYKKDSFGRAKGQGKNVYPSDKERGAPSEKSGDSERILKEN